jgi:8-oxo-dGTP pyrophosphatase MutT (NUDIX family)
MSDDATVPPHPSATVILLRDCASEVEVLLLRRSEKIETHGGYWVFPGGRVDEGDRSAPFDVLESARNAAVREVAEESGLDVARDELVTVSRWITPPIMPKRFDTWFFIAAAGEAEVEVDGEEIDLHRWLTPTAALRAFGSKELQLPPPTFVTLTMLEGFSSVGDALATCRARQPEEFVPRIERFDGGGCSLYHGDAGYESGEVDAPGPRHRLWFLDDGWRYERHGGDT